MRTLIVLMICFFFVCPVLAQERPFPLPNLEAITPDNADQLTELAVFQHFDARGRSAGITDVAFSPDGTLLAFIDQNIAEQAVFVWDVSTRTELASLEFGENSFGGSMPQHIVFSQDNGLLMCWDASGLRIWDTQTFDRLNTFQEIFGVRFAAFADESQSVVTVDWDGGLKRLDLETGEILFEVDFYLDDLYQDDLYQYVGALSRDGSRFIFSKRYFENDDLITDKLHVVDTLTGETTQVIDIHPATLDLFLSADGRILVTHHPNLIGNTNSFNTVSLVFWDTTNGEEIATWHTDGGRTPLNAVFSSDTKMFLTREFNFPNDQLLQLHNFPDGQKLFSLELQGQQTALAFHPNDVLIAATSDGVFSGTTHGRVHLFGVSPCFVTSEREVNLRTGPSTDFPAIESLTPSTKGFVIQWATDDSGFIWWQLTNGLWVNNEVVTLNNHCDTIREDNS